MARRTRKSLATSGAPSVGQHVCGLCHKGFSRRSTVKDPHFSMCVRKTGNPDDLPWDSHPTCWVKRGDGSSGPSGTIPPGKPDKVDEDHSAAPEKSSAIPTIATRYNERKPSTALSTLLEHRNLADPSRYALARRMAPETERGTPPSQTLRAAPYRALRPKSNANEQPSSSKQLPSFQSLRLPEVKRRISGLKMNQIASLVMGMSRDQAGKGDEDTLRVWNLWMDLNSKKAKKKKKKPKSMHRANKIRVTQKPDSIATSVEQPKPGSSQKERQQAVVWLAQDVYKGRFLVDVEGQLSDQLMVVAKFMDLAMDLEGMEGKQKIHEMLVGEIGEHAIAMLP
ncbi:MAG: hypothetical protein Q9168_001258 [Polycauliona sp. 1 TL-2023]